MAKPPIKAMRNLYTGMKRQRRSALILARWLRLFEIPCQDRHVGSQKSQSYFLPQYHISESDLELFTDKSLPLMSLESMSPLICACRVCRKPFCQIPDLREACSAHCRFEVATRKFGSSHWFEPSAFGAGRNRRVLVPGLPPWQRLLIESMLPKDKTTILEGRLISALHLGRSLNSHESVCYLENDVTLSTTRLRTAISTKIKWP